MLAHMSAVRSSILYVDVDVIRADCRTANTVPEKPMLQATAYKGSLSIGDNIDRITTAAHTSLIG